MNDSHPPKKEYGDLSLLPRRWFPLWHLDWYILREFLIKYSVLLLVFVILFILSDVYRDISDFLSAHAPARAIILYLLYKLPGNIRFILPISMLLGCMWTMATFGKNLEITAMRASGVSLFRCGGTIFVFGVIITSLNIYFNEALVPFTERQAEIIFTETADRRHYEQSLLAYRSGDKQRHWLFKTFNGSGNQDNVTIKTFWTDAMIVKMLGRPDTEEYRTKLRTIFQRRSEKILAMPRQEQLVALTAEMRGRKMDIFTASAYYDVKSSRWHFRNGYFVSYDRNDETRFVESRGTSAMHPQIEFKELTFDAAEIPESPFDIVNSIREKDDLPTIVIWDLVKRNPDMADHVRDIYMTVFFYRLAFPWACFLAVFLGIPLATKNERTGSMLAIITAVSFIVAYIAVAQVFLVLGKGGLLPPVIAGALPTAAFTAYGIWRLIRDRS